MLATDGSLNSNTIQSMGKLESVQYTITLTRVEANITSLLGMEPPTELRYHKCRRIQASSHNQAGIQRLGGGATTDDNDGMVSW